MPVGAVVEGAAEVAVSAGAKVAEGAGHASEVAGEAALSNASKLLNAVDDIGFTAIDAIQNSGLAGQAFNAAMGEMASRFGSQPELNEVAQKLAGIGVGSATVELATGGNDKITGYDALGPVTSPGMQQSATGVSFSKN